MTKPHGINNISKSMTTHFNTDWTFFNVSLLNSRLLHFRTDCIFVPCDKMRITSKQLALILLLIPPFLELGQVEQRPNLKRPYKALGEGSPKILPVIHLTLDLFSESKLFVILKIWYLCLILLKLLKSATHPSNKLN